nr:hypothetical protein [uncultured Pseudomonas sp.]
MTEHLKPSPGTHAGQKVRPETAKRNDTSENPNVERPWEAETDQGGVAPGEPSKDPESGA